MLLYFFMMFSSIFSRCIFHSKSPFCLSYFLVLVFFDTRILVASRMFNIAAG